MPLDGSWQRAAVAVALILSAATIIGAPSPPVDESVAAAASSLAGIVDSPWTVLLVASLGADLSSRVAAIFLLLGSVGLLAAIAPHNRRWLSALVGGIAGATATGSWLLPIDPRSTGGVLAFSCVIGSCALLRVSIDRPSVGLFGIALAMAAPAFHPLGFVADSAIAAVLLATPRVGFEALVRRTAPMVLYGISAPLLVFSATTIPLVMALRAGAHVDGHVEAWSRILFTQSCPTFLNIVPPWITWAILLGAVLPVMVVFGRRTPRGSQFATCALLVLWSPIPWIVVPTSMADDAPARVGSWVLFPAALAATAGVIEWGLHLLASGGRSRITAVALILVGLIAVPCLRLSPPRPHATGFQLGVLTRGIREALTDGADVRVVIPSELAPQLPSDFTDVVTRGLDTTNLNFRMTSGDAPKRAAPVIVMVEANERTVVFRPFRDGMRLPCSMSLSDPDIASAWLAASETPPTPVIATPWSGQFRAWNGEESFLSPPFDLSASESVTVMIEFARGAGPVAVGRIQLVPVPQKDLVAMPLVMSANLATGSIIAPSAGRYRMRIQPTTWPGEFTIRSIRLEMTRRGS